MNWQQDMAGENQEFAQALKHFKASMDAWSDAALSRPRTVAEVAVRPAAAGWRTAASWALGCLLAAGSLAGAVREIHHRQQQTKLAQKQAAEERAAAAREAAFLASAQVEKSVAAAATAKKVPSVQDADLLASVDSDISRQVPAAMEPLAQLMDDSGTP